MNTHDLQTVIRRKRKVIVKQRPTMSQRILSRKMYSGGRGCRLYRGFPSLMNESKLPRLEPSSMLKSWKLFNIIWLPF